VGGFFSTASGIDLYRNPGFITPGPNGVTLTNNNLLDVAPSSIDGFNGALLPNAYAMTSGKLFKLDLSGGSIINTGSFPYTFVPANSAGSSGNSILLTAINGNVRTLIFKDADIDFTDGTTITSNWGSTVCAGGVALQASVIHRAVEFSSYIFFTNGKYVSRIDGTTATGGTNGTMIEQKLVLPPGYLARDIKVIRGQLEIYVDNGAKAYILVWDGVSSVASEIIDLEDQKVLGANVVNGIPYVFTGAKSFGYVLRQKNFFGYPALQIINKTQVGVSSIGPYGMDYYNGMLIWNDASNIFTYGNPYAQYSYRGQDTNQTFPEALQSPIVTKGTTINALKVINGVIYASSNAAGPVQYLESFTLNDATYTTAASWKINFQHLPADSVIEWIRFVILPPSTGAAMTPVLYANNSTTPVFTGTDLTATTLDANGKNSKTYFVGGIIADNFAIGGTYATGSTSNPIIITRIDVGFQTKITP
jgi:hypothetical protein